MCIQQPVTCNIVSKANIQSLGASPSLLPQYAQQDAAADLDLDQSAIGAKDKKFFPPPTLQKKGDILAFLSQKSY